MRKAQRALLFSTIALFGAIACKKKADGIDAPLPATTTVSAADLKMRIAPNTTAAEIAHLSRGEEVRIVQRSAESVQVGQLNAYWYKVTNSTGLTGWVYGAHLAIESNEGDTQAAQEKTEKKMRGVLFGRWEAATTQGALSPNFVSLYPDGKIAFGTNRSQTQSGKYEIIFDGPIARVDVKDIKKPMMTDIKAKMVGETLVFTAIMDKEEYKLNLAEKDAGSFGQGGTVQTPVTPKP